MPLDKPEPDLATFLGWRDGEILSKLAEMDGRSQLDELKWLIRSRAFGRLKDLGDERAHPLINENDLSEFLRVKNPTVRPEPFGSGGQEISSRPDPRQK